MKNNIDHIVTTKRIIPKYINGKTHTHTHTHTHTPNILNLEIR